MLAELAFPMGTAVAVAAVLALSVALRREHQIIPDYQATVEREFHLQSPAHQSQELVVVVVATTPRRLAAARQQQVVAQEVTVATAQRARQTPAVVVVVVATVAVAGQVDRAWSFCVIPARWGRRWSVAARRQR